MLVILQTKSASLGSKQFSSVKPCWIIQNLTIKKNEHTWCKSYFSSALLKNNAIIYTKQIGLT